MKADLILSNLLRFDIISGQDWLFSNFTSISCCKRIVTLQLPREEEMMFKGSRLRTMLEIILAMQA